MSLLKGIEEMRAKYGDGFVETIFYDQKDLAESMKKLQESKFEEVERILELLEKAKSIGMDIDDFIQLNPNLSSDFLDNSEKISYKQESTKYIPKKIEDEDDDF